MLRRRAALVGLVLMLTCGPAAVGISSAGAHPLRSAEAHHLLTPQLDFLPNVVNGVACPSGGPCVAVGYYFKGNEDLALAESLVNGSWEVVPTPDEGSGINVLDAVSCVASGPCVAVGYYNNGKTDQTLVETLSNGSWQVTTSPNETTNANILNAVSCASSGACVAVGY